MPRSNTRAAARAPSVVVTAALVAAALAGCAATSQTPPNAAVEPRSLEAKHTEIVAVVQPDRADLSRKLALTGEFRAYQSVDIHARVAGYIRKIHVDVGDAVKAGSILAEIEVPELANDLTGAEATSQQLEAEIGRMEREVERAKTEAALAETLASRLASVQKREPGLIAKQETDAATLQHESALAQVRAAEAALGVARQRAAAAHARTSRSATMLEFRRITAPFSGVVTSRFADTGAMVQAANAASSQPIVRIAQIDKLRLVVPVPEESAGAIHPGTLVDVSIAAIGKTVQARVSRRSNELRRSTSTMDVEIDIPNPDRSLLPGMYADAVFSLDVRGSVLTVPVQALARREGKATLFVVDSSGKVAERDVRTGLATETKIEITAGLQEGDAVIIGDRSRLEVGQQVETKVIRAG